MNTVSRPRIRKSPQIAGLVFGVVFLCFFVVFFHFLHAYTYKFRPHCATVSLSHENALIWLKNTLCVLVKIISSGESDWFSEIFMF